MADHGHRGSVPPRFFGEEGPAQLRPNTVRLQEARRRPRPRDHLRPSVADDGEDVEVVRDGLLEDLVDVAPRHVADALHADDAVRLRERQRTQEIRVDGGEGDDVQAHSHGQDAHHHGREPWLAAEGSGGEHQVLPGTAHPRRAVAPEPFSAGGPSAGLSSGTRRRRDRSGQGAGQVPGDLPPEGRQSEHPDVIEGAAHVRFEEGDHLVAVLPSQAGRVATQQHAIECRRHPHQHAASFGVRAHGVSAAKRRTCSMPARRVIRCASSLSASRPRAVSSKDRLRRVSSGSVSAS